MGEHPHDKTSAGDKHDEMMKGHTHPGSEHGSDGIGRQGSAKPGKPVSGHQEPDGDEAPKEKPGKASKNAKAMGYDR